MSKLLEPLNAGKLRLKNRLVMPPMATAKSELDGSVTRDILAYYDEKSQGGYISLIIIEHSYVAQSGKANERQLSIAGDNTVVKLKGLADAIHKNGSKAVMQINHAGSAAKREVTGQDPLGPSAVPNPARDEVVPKVLEKHEIAEIVQAFKQAALRVKNAGFDGVEIHSAHGYLLSQFLSPLTNQRVDEYGGDLRGRMKLHLEIIKEIREAVGEDFPILLRLGASDYMEGGLTIAESKIAAQAFEQAGVDLLDISGGFCRYAIPGDNGPGFFAPLSEAIKEVVSIPVMVTGGITKPEEADDLLWAGKADLIGVGRAIYRDSNWAKVAVEKSPPKIN